MWCQGGAYKTILSVINTNSPAASFTSILPTADFILFLHITANEINWQWKNDGRVIFCRDARQRLQIPQLKVSANIMQCIKMLLISTKYVPMLFYNSIFFPITSQYRVIHHKVDETKLLLCLRVSQILFKGDFEILRQNNCRHCNQFL